MPSVLENIIQERAGPTTDTVVQNTRTSFAALTDDGVVAHRPVHEWVQTALGQVRSGVDSMRKRRAPTGDVGVRIARQRSDESDDSTKPHSRREFVMSMPGYKRFVGIQNTLEQVLPTRSNGQMRFHADMLAICTPLIFGDDWTTSAGAIVDTLGIDFNPFHLGLMISAPRRVGKTVAVSSFVASMLINMHGIKIVIYAHSQRASNEIGNKVRQYISGPLLSRPKNALHIDNQETIAVRALGGPSGALNVITMLPSSAAACRGQGGQILICEEMAFIPQNVYEEGCLPALSVNNTVMIGISTPAVEANHFNEVKNAEDGHGRKIFKWVEITTLCDDCVMAKAEKCTHKPPENPAWRNESRADTVRHLYANRTRYNREIGGITCDDNVALFNPVYVRKMFETSNRVRINNATVRAVFICVDPSAGGAGSDSAIISMCVTAHEWGIPLEITVSSLPFVPPSRAVASLRLSNRQALCGNLSCDAYPRDVRMHRVDPNIASIGR